MTIRLPPHKHCPNCDDPIAEDQEYCSDECRAEVTGKQKKTSRRNLLFYILAIGVLIAIWALSVIL